MPLISLDVRMLRSFVSVVETGSVTETARRLGRTQPAISLQLRSLEELTGKMLLRHEGGGTVLTNDGDIVLSYAKSILRLHDELLSRLASPDIEGHVVLGTPDLYAAFLLPSILELFRSAFPRVQIELRCALSTPLVGLVHRGEVDLALVTRMNGFAGGDVVGQEQLVWLMGDGLRRAPGRIRCRWRCCRPATSIATTRSKASIASGASGTSPASATASPACRPRCSPTWR